MNDIQSFQNLILHYSNFIHASVSSIHNQSQAGLIGLFYRFDARRREFISNPLSHD